MPWRLLLLAPVPCYPAFTIPRCRLGIFFAYVHNDLRISRSDLDHV
nr:MAG TPA: hypothetical protein [Caudoviricetes sp.]